MQLKARSGGVADRSGERRIGVCRRLRAKPVNLLVELGDIGAGAARGAAVLALAKPDDKPAGQKAKRGAYEHHEKKRSLKAQAADIRAEWVQHHGHILPVEKRKHGQGQSHGRKHQPFEECLHRGFNPAGAAKIAHAQK